MGAIREYQFISGPETATLPTSPTPTAADDLVPLGYLSSSTSVGTIASPVSVSANGTITVPASLFTVKVITGNGAAVNALLASGTVDRQRVMLIGASDSNTVTILSTATFLSNGSITLGLADTIEMIWLNTDAVWVEVSRNA